MKKIFLLLFLTIGYFFSFAQPISNRGTTSVTVSDARLQAQYNLFIPRYTDTAAANLQKGIDSCGAIIFTYNGNKLWKRNCSPKKWKEISEIADGIDSLKRSSDSIYAYKNNQWIFQYKDSVGGGGSTPNLQAVTDVGSTTTNTIQIDKDLSSLKLFNNIGSFQYDLLNYQLLDGTLGTFYVRVDQNNFAAPHIYSYGQDGEYLITANESGLPKLNFNTSGDFFNMSGGGKSFSIVPDSTIYDNTFIGGTSTILKYNYQTSVSGAENKKYFFPTHNFGSDSDDTINITTNVNGNFADENGTITLPLYWTKSNNYTYLTNANDSVGIGTSAPDFKLDVDGVVNSTTGFNLSNSTVKTGIYGNSNNLDFWSGNNKMSSYGLVGNVSGSYFKHDIGFNNFGSSSGTQNALEISSSITPTGANSMIHNQIAISPTYDQSTYGTGTIRGIYYNPTITNLNTSAHYAWESTSGGIKFGNMSSSTDTSTYKPLGIDASGNLSKVSSWNLNGIYVPYVGATQDLDMGVHQVNAQSFYANGSNGNGHIHLKHQSADATGQGQTTTIFADANGDFKWKNAGNYYTTLKTSGNTADRVYTYPNATTSLIGASDTASMLSNYAKTSTVNTKLNISDTASMLSKYQQKFQQGNSILANNTATAGSPSPIYYKDTSGTYTGTISWTGTTPPTTATISTYQWTQTGKWVTLHIHVYYTNAGTSLTAVTLAMPSDCPAPDLSNYTTGASAIYYNGIGGLGLSSTATTFTITSAYLRRNAGNTANEIYIAAGPANYRRIEYQMTYRAQ